MCGARSNHWNHKGHEECMIIIGMYAVFLKNVFFFVNKQTSKSLGQYNKCLEDHFQSQVDSVQLGGLSC